MLLHSYGCIHESYLQAEGAIKLVLLVAILLYEQAFSPQI